MCHSYIRGILKILTVLHIHVRMYIPFFFFEHLARWQVEALRGARSGWFLILPHGVWRLRHIWVFWYALSVACWRISVFCPAFGPVWVAHTYGQNQSSVQLFCRWRLSAIYPSPIRAGVHIKVLNCFFLATAVRLSLFPYWSFSLAVWIN